MNKLVIIGASYLQIPLIKKAKEMGLETHAFAWEDGAVGNKLCDHFYPISIIEKEEIARVSKEIDACGVASIASDLASITVNYVADKLNLTGNSISATGKTTNKYLMRKALKYAGLPCPAFSYFTEDSKLDISGFSFPVIVKPTDRSGSRGVSKVDNLENIAAAAKRAFTHSFSKEILVEEFVSGGEVSVEMISWKGEHYPLAITDKVTTGSPFFVETEHHQPALIGELKTQEVYNLVKKALTSLGVENGASHSELIITQEGKPVFVEIGARMGGDYIGSHLVELSTGYDFLKGVIEVALGDFSGVRITKSSCSGVYFQGLTPGEITGIIDKTHLYHQIVEKNLDYAPGHILETVQESGNRSGYFIYSDKSKFIPSKEIYTYQIMPNNN